jgi:hypothetical protein
MNAMVRRNAAAVVGALAAGAVGFGIALTALRTVGPYAVLICALPFALRGWWIGRELVPGRGAIQVGGLIAGGLMGLFLEVWALLLAPQHTVLPIATAPLAALCAIRGFWWTFDSLERRRAYRL